MKLRHNAYCPIHRSLAVAVASRRNVSAGSSPGFVALKIPIRGDIENSDPQPKCGNF